MVLKAIWQFMDRDVTHKILCGPKPNFPPKWRLGETGNKFYVIKVNLDEDVIWTGWLSKTNRENIKVKYNIYIYVSLFLFYNIVFLIRETFFTFFSSIWYILLFHRDIQRKLNVRVSSCVVNLHQTKYIWAVSTHFVLLNQLKVNLY
jgi:hypothetical protein